MSTLLTINLVVIITGLLFYSIAVYIRASSFMIRFYIGQVIASAVCFAVMVFFFV